MSLLLEKHQNRVNNININIVLELCLSDLTFTSLCRYLGRGFDSRRDLAEPGRRAVHPRPVVLIPVTGATCHCCNHGDVGQEEEEEEEELHREKRPSAAGTLSNLSLIHI